ncbi:hypothetical protein EXIGLDRAFT_129617 [Exidia glandulosa HHB12029]|uniref:Uncharacterized protein n=1 Tax=Exidia glandulosa HHB12029 TaxID=1314781 RepID=A0A165G582_EXIGL|nr:hypothetical protein EXIGLDRAFT_129617 [Exidia glandulosa HHB12029]
MGKWRINTTVRGRAGSLGTNVQQADHLQPGDPARPWSQRLTATPMARELPNKPPVCCVIVSIGATAFSSAFSTLLQSPNLVIPCPHPSVWHHFYVSYIRCHFTDRVSRGFIWLSAAPASLSSSSTFSHHRTSGYSKGCALFSSHSSHSYPASSFTFSLSPVASCRRFVYSFTSNYVRLPCFYLVTRSLCVVICHLLESSCRV